MRILWCARKYLDASLDSSTWTGMVRALSDAGHETSLLTGYLREKRDFGLGGRLAYVPSIKFPVLNVVSFTVAAAIMLPRAVSATGADVVLLDPSTVWSALPLIAWSRISGAKRLFVMDVRTLPVDTGRRTRDAVERIVFRSALRLAGVACDGLTAITTPMANRVGELAHIDAGSIGVWTSGVDMRLFDSSLCGTVRPSETDDLIVMYHGGMLASRGLDDAVVAMGILRDRGVSGIRLRLVGSGLDAEAIASRVDELCLAETVSVEAPVSASEVPALLCEATVGLLPFPDLECWRVSSPLKLMEYLSMERPVIVTPLACNREVLGDAPWAVWARSSSPEDLADAMSQAADDRESLLAAALAGARRMVADRYTWDVQAARLVSFLVRLRGSDAR